MALLVDLALCVLTVWLAFYLRLGELVPLTGPALWAVAAASAGTRFSMVRFGNVLDMGQPVRIIDLRGA